MRKEPSLHINRTQLTLLMDDAIRRGIIELSDDTDLGELVDFLLSKGSLHQLTPRKILENAKNKVKVTKIGKSSRGDAQLVASLLYKGRKAAKHENITKIKEESKDWVHIKDLTSLVKSSAEDLGLDLEELIREYIPQFIKSMGRNFRISRYRSVHEITLRHLESQMVLKKDPTPNSTKELHDIYLDEYEERIGIRPKPMWMYPDMYIHFFYAKELAEEMGVDNRLLIESQFEGLEWANSCPEPNQLYGEKAEGRLRKYLYQKKRLRKGKGGDSEKGKVHNIDWGFLKREIE